MNVWVHRSSDWANAYVEPPISLTYEGPRIADGAKSVGYDTSVHVRLPAVALAANEQPFVVILIGTEGVSEIYARLADRALEKQY